MKSHVYGIAASTLGLVSGVSALAAEGDYSLNTPLRSSPGLINETLRGMNESMNPWDIGVNFRLRYEVHEHYAIAGTPGSVDFRSRGTDVHNNYLLSRVRPHIGYTGEWFRIYTEGRDSRAFNDDREPSPEEDSFDLHQAFVEIGNKSFPLSLKVGRQELLYGDERLVGPLGWHNIGRVFDAAKLRYSSSWVNADVFTSRLVLPDDDNFNTFNENEYFSGVYATTKAIPGQTTDIYFLSRNANSGSPNHPGSLVAGASPRDIYTVGVRFKSDPAKWAPWDYTAELMGQFGRFNDPALPSGSRSLDHQAFAVSAAGGYTWKEVAGTPRLGVEYNFATGDDDPTDRSHETFDNLYPTNHKFYGIMDFVSLQNIHNVRLTTSVKPLPRISVTADAHAFWLAETSDNFYTVGGGRRGGIGATAGNGYGINPGYDRYIGSELDLVVSYAVSPLASVEAGYGHFFAGDYIDQSLSAPTHGSSDADFFYLQLILNF